MPTQRIQHQGELDVYFADEGSGPPVVLIGGFTSTAEVWDVQVPALRDNYRVLRPDNRGSGRTELIQDDGTRTIERFAGDLNALLAGLDLEPFHLVGASMGGMIVQQFAVDYPDRLRSLTIACSHPGGSAAVSPDPQTAADFALGSAADATDEQRKKMLEIVAHPSSLAERPELVQAYEESKLRFPHASEELAARAAGISSFDVSKRLGEIRVPTLVLTGAEDRIVPPENSRTIAEAIDGAELVEIPKTSHLFFLERPEEVNSALVSFLGRH